MTVAVDTEGGDLLPITHVYAIGAYGCCRPWLLVSEQRPFVKIPLNLGEFHVGIVPTPTYGGLSCRLYHIAVRPPSKFLTMARVEKFQDGSGGFVLASFKDI